MDEKVTERWLGRKVKEMGGLWYKFTSPGHAGVPDRVMILRGKTYYVEMKTETGRLSAIQKATARQMVEVGGVSVHVVYGPEGARNFLDAIERPEGFMPDDVPDVWEWK